MVRTTAQPTPVGVRCVATRASVGTSAIAGARRSSSRAGSRALSWALSLLSISVITVVFTAFVPELWHWMIIPTAFAGVLAGVDVVEWLRRRLDVLQPRAVVALFALHLCYLAPLLHVTWAYWPNFLAPAEDWRISLGLLAVLNTVGLLMYQVVLSFPIRQSRAGRNTRPEASMNSQQFVVVGTVAALAGLAALVLTVARFGGPEAYLKVITGSRGALAGSGWALLVAESWPMLLFAVVLVAGRNWFQRHLFMLVLLILLFVLVQLGTGGLRGSRANTVWPTLMAIGLVHVLVLRISRRVVVAGALVLVAFMYAYGLYKSAGTQVLGLVNRSATIAALSDQTGRDLPLLLLEDFGRAGTQSALVDRVQRGADIAWGETYVGDLTKLVPELLVPATFEDKVSAGTDVLYGQGSFDTGLRSSRIYGLVGEGLLNFGLIGGAIAFLPLALLVRCAERLWSEAMLADRLELQLLVPMLAPVVVVTLGSDLDNVLWFIAKYVAPLALVIIFARINFANMPPARRLQLRSIGATNLHGRHLHAEARTR
jgi:hypothetical protein